MNSYAYYNGNFGKRNEIRIPLSDRAFFFGDAVYDAAIGSYDRILWEDEHIERFLSNANKIGIIHEIDKRFLSSLLHEVAIKSMLKSYFIYFQISRDLPARIHSSLGCKSNLLITVDPIVIDRTQTPLKLITTEDLRYGYCNIKTINLLPAVLSATAAEKAGCDEAVFIRNDYVTECSKSNISILKQGRLITHPISNRILPGIVRAHLLTICRELGIDVDERPFTKKELFSADEILVSSTTKLCKTVSRIDGLAVGGKSPTIAEEICIKMYAEYENYCLI